MKYENAALLILAGLLNQPAFAAQAESAQAPNAASTGAADGPRISNSNSLERSPALTGVRHPPYRLNKSDVIEIKFIFSPEFDQTITVQPDGFLALKAVGDLFVEGLSISEVRDAVTRLYRPMLRDPDISVILRDFDKPYFIAGGQFGRPGKYEIRSATSVSEAVAIAGGFTEQSKHSEVVLFRRIADGVVEAHIINVKAMMASRNLEEDMEIKPGDMLFVPQNRISKIRKFLPVSSLSTFFTPAQF
jgi:polysaccharide export outer membrane protein